MIPMHRLIHLFLLSVLLTVAGLPDAAAQCDIKNRLYPDGTMLYYIEPVNFYWTEAKSLKGAVYTNKEDYFIGFQPYPFPEKPLGNKIRKDASITLSNGKAYLLEHYDSRYVDNDSALRLLFLIDKSTLDDFLNYEVTRAGFDQLDSAGTRVYNFKLHKKAIQEQLACFLREQEKKKE
jgi:hypothetical protein